MKRILIPILMLCMGFANQVKAEGTYTDTDLTKFDNVIYVAPMTVNPNDGTEVNLSVCMNNTAEIRGFQFDMYLPTGMTAVSEVEDGETYYFYELNAARQNRNKHELNMEPQADGAFRFLCGNQKATAFKGNEGEVANFTVSIKGMADGSYPITLKNVKLTETDISKYYEVAEVTTTLTISSATNIKSVNTDVENGNVYDLQGRKVVKAAKKGLYIKNGKKEVVR